MPKGHCGALPARYTHATPGRFPDMPDGGLCELAVRLYGATWDHDDAYQTAALAMVQARRTFDPAKGKWSTWAMFYMKGRLTAWRKLYAKRRSAGPVPGYTHVADLDGLPGRAAADPPAASNAELAEALRCLADAPLDLIRRHFWGGETFSEIAAGLGVSRQRAEQLTHAALAELRDLLGAAAARAGRDA